jgi:pimeloyl-ACP methyl ester carboxylesterase
MSTVRRPLVLLALASALLAGLLARARPAAAAARPTVVLVHGAFADASGWSGEIGRLRRAGYPVLAPADPLRGVASDAAYLDSILATIPGPVVLVGHSYGGAVITEAATSAVNVKALVYIAAFAPDQGESAFDLVAKNPGSLLGPATLLSRPFKNPDGSDGVDEYIKPASFRSVFAQDLPAAQADELAAAQRPMTAAALVEKSGVPAWKTLPDWYMVAGRDHAIPPKTERFMAARMKAHTVTVDASHAVLISQPAKVTDLILRAARVVG